MAELKYSVIVDTLATFGLSIWEKPHEVLELVASAGYDGVDLTAEPDRFEKKRYQEITDLARSMGLEIAALLGAWAAWHAGEGRDLASTDEAARSYAVSYAKKCTELAVDLNVSVYEICCCAAVPQYPVHEVPLPTVRKNFVKSAREISAHAAEQGVRVAMEPVNRFEGYPGFMNSVVDAVSVAEEVGLDNLGVMVDFFHANMEDVSVADAIRRAGQWLMLIHLADSNREMPGTGHINFTGVIGELDQLGFQGYLSLDCLPARPDAKTYLVNSIRYMKELEEAVALRERLSGRN
jgi:sugar phosphate isomerase/epimerase